MKSNFKSVLICTLISVICFSASKLQAQILAGSGDQRTFAGSELKLVGKGIRSKVILFSIKVYELSFFSDNSTKALELKLLRNLDSEKIKKAFEDALKVNSVNINSPKIQDFFAFVNASGEINEGQVIRLVSKNENHIIMENQKGEKKEFDEPMIGKNIFSIWFGVPVDDNMAELQKQIKK